MLYISGAEVQEAWSRNITIEDGNTTYHCFLWANEDSNYQPRFCINRVELCKLDLWFKSGPHTYATIYGFNKDQLLNATEDFFMKLIKLILNHCEDVDVDVDMEKFLW